MTIVAPFDLYYWLVTFFAGSLDIFIPLTFVAIAAMAAYFRMPNLIAVVSLVLFGLIMYSYIGGIFILLLMGIAIFLYFAISKMMTR